MNHFPFTLRWIAFVGLLVTLTACANATPTPLAPTDAPTSIPATATLPPTATVTHGPRPTRTPTAIPHPTNTPRPYTFSTSSPDNQFYVDCRGDKLQLYRKVDQTVRSQITITLNSCDQQYVFWSPNSTHFISLDWSDKLIFWTLTGTTAIHTDLGIVDSLKWSPDGARLVVFTSSPNTTDSLVVLQPDGTEIRRIGLETIGLGVSEITWLSDSLVLVDTLGGCCEFNLYFDVAKGIQLSPWYSAMAASQPPSFSPDMRWRILDNSSRDEGDIGWVISHEYLVLNLQSDEEFSITADVDYSLQWGGWTDDSQTFYLVSHPANDKAHAKPELPFGLLALNPATRQFTVLFEQAVYAVWSPDKSKWFVVFPARRANGALGIDGGIFDPTTNALSGRQPIADEMLYNNPSVENHNFALAEWSPDSRQVTYQGKVWTVTP